MHVGVDYYPEHWPRERWETDADLMQEAGFNVVRLAEFAWAQMEPAEGRYEFDWLAEALELLGARGIRSLLCTPTATMPAWVARRYPEALVMQPEGHRTVWGVRKNNCFSNPDYRRLSRAITRAMAERFADSEHVIGWQTDNEFGGAIRGQCHCPDCREAFRAWLRERHGSLAALNEHWGTHFWSQTYGAWEEIQPPPDDWAYNPGLTLDWKRFYTELNVRFQREQIEILRELCPDHFVTHNLMGLATALDYHRLAEDLDHVSWDNYPVMGARAIPYDAAAAADLMRGTKGRTFWIMEQTAGPGGWNAMGRNPRPGEIRLVAYQQLAHGCDGQVWFRWRTCTTGREQYWHGLLGHDGKPGRRYREAARTAGEYRRLAPHLAGSTVPAEAAILWDYETIWALQIQPGFPGNDWLEAMRRYQRALFRRGLNVDLVPPDRDLSAYRLVVAPQLFLLPDERAGRLSDFVAGGGVLLGELRTGVKDEHNRCHPRTLPGLLGECLGLRIPEYGTLHTGEGEETVSVAGRPPFPGRWTAAGFAEWVQPDGAEVLAGYEPWYLEPYAALTRHRHGEGVAYFTGTVLREDAYYDALVDRARREAGLQPLVEPPAGVEVSVRQGPAGKLLFLLNHTEEEQTVAVPPERRELLSGQTTGRQLTLPRLEVAVLQL
jgi:beta-galactosidase